MAFNDLREFIAAVDGRGECKIIEDADAETEIGAICELESQQPDPRLLVFDRVKGFAPGFRVASNLFSTHGRTALALGLPADLRGAALVRAFKERLKTGTQLIPPVEVKQAPVKENILTGDEVDIMKFPAPRWHELDGGRYIGTGDCVIMRDPEEGWVNFGTYRVQLHERTKATVRMARSRDGYLIARKFWSKGLPCPVAVSCGQEPLLFSAASWERVPWGVSEYDFAGGLGNKPVQVTPGVYTGLPVPATAEIVLEGDLMAPEVETLKEGPFGEWPGYYNGPFQEPVLNVKAVLHRNAPIIQGNQPSRFPGVWTLGRHIQKAAVLWNELERNMPAGSIHGVRMVEDASIHPMVVISLKQQYEGQAKQAALLATACSATAFCLKFVIVVDEDIDPFNTSEVLWAMATRCEPQSAIDIIRGGRGLNGVAWESPERRRLGTTEESCAIILACKPFHWIKHFPPSVKSSEALLQAVRDKWAKTLWQ